MRAMVNAPIIVDTMTSAFFLAAAGGSSVR
jgi:hypothetical protein